MMKKMAVEMQKIKGTRILEVTRMGGEAMVPPATGDVSPPPPPPPPPANDSAAPPSTASKLGALGSMLGKSMMGGLHGNNAAAAPPPATGSSGNPTQQDTMVLFESTSQKSDFSRSAVPADLFQVPAGFKQVESSWAQSPAK